MVKKILIATGIFPPDIGGPALYAQKLAEEFFNQGVKITVITYGKDFIKSPKYQVIGVSRSWPIGLRQLVYFWKILMRVKNSDAILTLDSLGAGLPSVLAGKVFRKKVILRSGGDFLWEKYVESGKGNVTMTEFYSMGLYRIHSLLNRLIIFTLRQADFIAFTTLFQRDLLVKHCGLSSYKTSVISNVFEKKKGLSAQYQENPKIILWAGRFIKLKNLDFLLKVFKQLLERDNNLVLELIGDGPEKANIINLIQSMSLSNKVRIIDGLNRNVLLEKMNKSYFGVLPSLSDISPNFVLECLSLNKPVIVTQETGIKDQFPGLICADPQNEDSFFKAALKLLDKNYYDNYQKFISGIGYHKTWQDLAKEYLEILNSY